MASRNLETWMWEEAVHMLDRADRMQREFCRLGTAPRPQWEPPVDVYETADAVWVIVALPGVTAEHLVVQVHEDVLIVVGEHRLAAPARSGVLHRLEIPHGRFERRLRLPFPHLRIARHDLRDGCLYLQLRKTAVAP